MNKKKDYLNFIVKDTPLLYFVLVAFFGIWMCFFNLFAGIALLIISAVTAAWYVLKINRDAMKREKYFSLMAEGNDKIDIAKSVTVAMVAVGTDGKITLTGGCAKNAGLKAAIEKVLKIKVAELKTDPQLMGALGAAEFARAKGLAELAENGSEDWKNKPGLTIGQVQDMGLGTM